MLRLLIACLLVSACHGSNGASDAGAGDDTSMDDSCAEFMAAVVAHYEACGCQSELIETLRAQLDQCVLMKQQAIHAQLVGSGEVKFHPEVFAKLAARLRDPKASCSTYFGDMGLDSVSVYGMDGVYEGTREVGQSCTVALGTKGGINTCKAGALCWPDENDQGRCLALVGKGKACDLGAAGRNLCHDRRPPDNDNEFETAFDALTCVPDSPGASTGTCRDQLEAGSVCGLDEACKSGRCAEGTGDESMCMAKLADGAKCLNRSDCQSGACSGVCSAPLADGMKCGYDDLNCQSGSCHTIDDASSGTSPGSCGPKLAKKLGAACTQGYECESQTCRDDVCRPRLCR
jgi:hypothetical protein